jgi:hypothetical protein
MFIQIGCRKIPDTGEHKITVMKDGQYSEDASYYSDDLIDALNSGDDMYKRYKDSGNDVVFTKTYLAKWNEHHPLAQNNEDYYRQFPSQDL